MKLQGRFKYLFNTPDEEAIIDDCQHKVDEAWDSLLDKERHSNESQAEA